MAKRTHNYPKQRRSANRSRESYLPKTPEAKQRQIDNLRRKDRPKRIVNNRGPAAFARIVIPAKAGIQNFQLSTSNSLPNAGKLALFFQLRSVEWLV